MKKVLIIDSHQLFRDFLKQKLSVDQIEVVLTQENRDSYPKMLSVLPNLIILDMSEERIEEMDFLEKKANDPNTANIPVIITGPSADKSSIASLAKYGVIKYFEKPIQFDVFFESIGKVLKIPLSMDTTPCVMDLHRNNSLIFIEIAQGLNREKLALLQYKLSEMIQNAQLDSPRIIIMLTALDLTFVDGFNLEFLLDNILACPKVHGKNVKVLSLSPFMRDFLDGHTTYSGIEISNNLPKVLNSLVDTTITSSVSDLITDKILTPSYGGDDHGSIETRFYSDTNKTDAEAGTKSDGTVLNVAILDSDLQSLAQTRAAFEAKGAHCFLYTKGSDFLAEAEKHQLDLLVMDIALSDNTGFNVLGNLRLRYDAPPAVIYTQNLQKEILTKCINAGAKNILQKPQKPAVLIQKCLSVLKSQF